MCAKGSSQINDEPSLYPIYKQCFIDPDTRRQFSSEGDLVVAAVVSVSLSLSNEPSVSIIEPK